MAFTAHERSYLLSLPQIGPGLLRRLEDAGFDSLALMQRAGAQAVIDAVCRRSGHIALGNRRRALQRALASAAVNRASAPTAGARSRQAATVHADGRRCGALSEPWSRTAA